MAGGTGQLLSLLTAARQGIAEWYKNVTRVLCSTPGQQGGLTLPQAVVQSWVTWQSLSHDFHDKMGALRQKRIKPQYVVSKKGVRLHSCDAVPSVVTEGTFFLWLGLKNVLLPWHESQFQQRPLFRPAADAAVAVHYLL